MKVVNLILQNSDDVIAIALVIGCLTLLYFHIDGEIRSILSLAAGWIFGKRFYTMRKGR
jgi:hypothetical protein